MEVMYNCKRKTKNKMNMEPLEKTMQEKKDFKNATKGDFRKIKMVIY